MALAPLRFIKQCIEFREFTDSEVKHIPRRTRGFYVLYKKNGKNYEVVYIGMAGGPHAGVHGRLRDHLKKKNATHFSVFEAHDNVSEEEVRELEGLLRHVFARDRRVDVQATQRTYGKLRPVAKENWAEWAGAR
jgi:RNase adaptor protein for sRNA GlmZ degradation